MTEHYFTNNGDLKSETRLIQYNYGDGVLEFTSDLGVFSKNKLDYGSRLLIENYIEHGKNNIDLLDVGCGYGFIGLSLARIKNTNSTMVDVNKRAVHLTQMNIKNNKIKNAVCFESNIYESVEGLYDVVITNPPIRAGKKIVYDIVMNAKDYLEDEDSEFDTNFSKEDLNKDFTISNNSNFVLTDAFKKMISEADTNEDGQISLEELKDIMIKFFN